MRFLGMSPTHDSSVCLIEDGRIKKFFKEERLTRKKRDMRPINSLKKTLEDIDSVDFFSYAPPREGDDDNFLSEWYQHTKNFAEVKNSIDFSADHHKIHAALAFYNSGFSDAAVIVVDAQGSLTPYGAELETIFHASYPDNFIPVYKNLFNNTGMILSPSIKDYPDCEVMSKSYVGAVAMYCSATVLIGEHVLENGKTMGLAAYGKEDKIPNFLYLNDLIVNKNFFTAPELGFPMYKKNIDHRISLVSKENYQLYANYAFHVQKQSEKIMISLIKKAIEKTGCKNICVSGGYGLNVVANSLYIKEFPDINFYFEPIADDGGNSIGSAMLAYRQETKDKTISKINNIFYHGNKYSLSKIKDLSIKFNESDASDMLIDQKSIAIYYDLAEAGPRALGHRSILFDARNKDAKDIVNKIKKREWYRPFAAACLEKDAYKYFDISNNIGYEFMTINADANSLAKKEIPGVLHVDDTCRIQIVKDEGEPLFQLLNNFKSKTGIGVLLNTSFNLAGEALVETPEDAISSYERSELDCVWFPEIDSALLKTAIDFV